MAKPTAKKLPFRPGEIIIHEGNPALVLSNDGKCAKLYVFPAHSANAQIVADEPEPTKEE
jgi:hypothetical protein